MVRVTPPRPIVPGLRALNKAVSAAAGIVVSPSQLTGSPHKRLALPLSHVRVAALALVAIKPISVANNNTVSLLPDFIVSTDVRNANIVIADAGLQWVDGDYNILAVDGIL